MPLPDDESAAWCRLLNIPADADALTVCRAFERVAVSLAPIDLDGLPIYAMPASALPPEFTTASRHSGGWYHDMAYHWARQHLPDDHGPGPTVFVKDICNDEAAHNIAIEAQTIYATTRGKRVSIKELLQIILLIPLIFPVEAICGTLVHELGHALSSLAEGDWQMWDEVVDMRKQSRIDWSLKQFDQLVEYEYKQQQDSKSPPQLDSHGLRFTRIICHLDYRLRAAGVCSEHLGAAGERFEQQEYADCYAALGDEPSDCRDESFAEILARPMPAAFMRCSLTGNEEVAA